MTYIMVDVEAARSLRNHRDLIINWTPVSSIGSSSRGWTVKAR
jgi:hypothetical protein